jgi:multidrug efflux pump subunit AcrA (membrane-fusion protein)
MSDRMAASAAANKVREKLNAIKAKLAAASGVPNAIKDVEAAEKEVADAKVKWEQERADEAAAAAKAALDPQYATLKQAVKEHRVLVGMSEEQVRTAWPDAAWVPKAADENGKTYEVTNADKEVYDLTFQGGKLTFVYRP